MKKINFAALIFAVCILLTSCVGIGDGAMFDDIKTSEPQGDATEDGEKVICRLAAYYGEPNEIMDEAVVEGSEAREIYEYLNDSSNYTNTVDEVAMSHPYIRVTFEGIADTNEYYVRSSDNVDINDTLLLWGRTGHLPGAYENLFGYIVKYGASKGYFCNISTENAPHAMVSTSGDSVYQCSFMLSEGDYLTGMDRTDEVQTYIMLSFFGSDNATYYVYSDDYVCQYGIDLDTDSLYQPLGFLDGIYDRCLKLYEEALDNVTDEERAAGVKLNCLSVKVVDDSSFGMSITYSATFFEEIGCTYMKLFDYNSYLIYFESCSKEELEEKIAVLDKMLRVESVAMVAVGGYDETSTLE